MLLYKDILFFFSYPSFNGQPFMVPTAQPLLRADPFYCGDGITMVMLRVFFLIPD